MSEWRMLVHRKDGTLLERLKGTEAELREGAERITSVRGQFGWKCYLFGPNGLVAICKRGKWKAVEI